MNPLIREGETSEQVSDVQTRLRALGIEVGDDPGYFGVDTVRAVRTFQQRRGLIVDGIVGARTWEELVEAGWHLGDRILYLKNPPMRGDDVLALQIRLGALGFDAGRQDGIFGRNTDRAVRAFQKEYGVAEDGIFGADTHAALIGLRVERPGTSADLREELHRAESSGLRQALIAIDPGHGGDDAGEMGATGQSEADICWDLSLRLAERLVRAGARVRFTRRENENPDVTTRAQRANQVKADLLLSLHLNANQVPAAEGASTYHFAGSRSAEALAELVQRSLSDIGRRDCRHHARYYPLLKETRMPAVIVEPAFITNVDEAKQLANPDFRNQIADALVTALRSYF